MLQKGEHNPQALPPGGERECGTMLQDNSNKGGYKPSAVLRGKAVVAARTSMSSNVFIIVVTHLEQEDEDVGVICASGEGVKPTHHPSWPLQKPSCEDVLSTWRDQALGTLEGSRRKSGHAKSVRQHHHEGSTTRTLAHAPIGPSCRQSSTCFRLEAHREGRTSSWKQRQKTLHRSVWLPSHHVTRGHMCPCAATHIGPARATQRAAAAAE